MRFFWRLLCRFNWHWDVEERPYCLYCGQENTLFNPYHYYHSK